MRKSHLDKIDKFLMDFIFYVALPFVAAIHIVGLYYPSLGEMLFGH